MTGLPGTAVARRAAVPAAGAAALLAIASAAVTADWALGGTVLLDTVGGAMESLARERTAGALLLGAAVVGAELAAAVLAVALLRRPGRAVRVLAVLAGVLLTGWGLLNVLLGGAVPTGLLDLGPVADERALRWHVLCWDAWFLVWGVALLTTVRATHPGQRGGAVDPRSTSTGSTSSARWTG